ncbi:MAG: hypothetical protein H7A40_04875 [Chlamydiales bacterium]|nr:hypothetical protein [Chlamydiales bacterium]
METNHILVMFGAAERGEMRAPILCNDMAHLAEALGNPPDESQGIPFAIQALLFNRTVYYVRVEEEGFSRADYFQGFSLLQTSNLLPKLTAIGLPGVGDSELIDAASQLCHPYKSMLITSEQDLFDYLTA